MEKNFKSTFGCISSGRFLFIMAIASVCACSGRKDLIDQKLYEGPISSQDSINTLLSDSAEIVMHLRAARQNNFESGDREWPSGLFLESFSNEGETKTSFRADYVYYTQADNIYRSEGNVIVQNLATGDELNTEELFWDPNKEEFYTEKFVTIKSEDEVHTGEGLQANQDFTSYRILKPTGSFILDNTNNSKQAK